VSISDYTNIRLHILGLKEITARTNDGLVREPVEVTFTINFPDMDVSGGYQSFFDGSLGLFVVESDDANWYIYQRRYGHGIGMSQRGAQQRAKDPDPAVNTYTAILDFYYPDYPGYPTTELTSLY
jgi:SpoIID/LytB domain protein